MSEIIVFPCTEKSLRRCRKDRLSTESINLRLVRVNLSTGTTEILITSLIDGLSSLMIERISKITNPYRPDRKFERPHCRMIRVKYVMAYKRPC